MTEHSQRRVNGTAYLHEQKLIADHLLRYFSARSVLFIGPSDEPLIAAIKSYEVEVQGIDLNEDLPSGSIVNVLDSFTSESTDVFDLLILFTSVNLLLDEDSQRLAGAMGKRAKNIILFFQSTLSADQRSDLRWDLGESFSSEGLIRDYAFQTPTTEHQKLICFRKWEKNQNALLVYYRNQLENFENQVGVQAALIIEQARNLSSAGEDTVSILRQLQFEEVRWQVLEKTTTWKIAARITSSARRLIPPGSNRERWFILVKRGSQVLKTEGTGAFCRAFFRKVGRKANWAFTRIRWRLSRVKEAEYVAIQAVEKRSDVEPHRNSVDIIICLHNALDDLQRCLTSVVQNSSGPYHLILIDDGSETSTSNYLKVFADQYGAEYHRNEEAGGYTFAANQGLRASTGDHVILLNSDTIVTCGWLDRLVACAESDPKIGMVGPLSNTASWQSVPEIEWMGDWATNPLPEGMSVEEMGKLVAQYSDRLYPRLPFLNGFCLTIKRKALDDIGYFDEENFGRGYGEENDFAIRMMGHGWELAVADDTYIFHAQSKSYSSERRKTLSEKANERLIELHGAEHIAEGVAQARDDRVMAGIRASTCGVIARTSILEEGREKYRGKKILVILPISMPGGGGNVVKYEAIAMRKMEVEIDLFNLRAHRQQFEKSYPHLPLKVVYGEVEDISQLGLYYDAVIATYNPSVVWMKDCQSHSGFPIRAYYIQDYEPFFYPPASDQYQIAVESYTQFSDLIRFTKTEWTRQQLIEKLNIDACVVGASVDLDLFRPRPKQWPGYPHGPIRITAMVRPESAYREPEKTMRLLREAAKRFRGQVEICIFGTSPDNPGYWSLPRDFYFKSFGVLSQEQVATLLNETDIFLDHSSHQAMGLTALEAMACGCAVIVPEKGGATSFARSEQNSLVVDTSQPQMVWEAVNRLINDDNLRLRIQKQAIKDVQKYSPENAAFNILNTLFSNRR